MNLTNFVREKLSYSHNTEFTCLQVYGFPAALITRRHIPALVKYISFPGAVDLIPS